MSITSSTYTIGHQQVDGRRYVTETHTDDVEGVITREYLAPAGWGATEYESVMAAEASAIATRLAEAEAAALLDQD